MTDYKNLTDEELAILAGDRDSLAFEELYYRYAKIVRYFCRNLFLIGGETEDLLQEGYAGLFKAVQTFDKEKGNFMNFACLCISKKIANKIDKSNAKKNEALSTALPIETLVETQSQDLSPLESLVGKEGYEELLESINGVLSETEKSVFDLYLKGYSYTEIAKELSLTKKQTDNAINRFKNKIKKFIKEKSAL